MFAAAEELRFEYAAKLRDEIKELRRELVASPARPPTRRSARPASRARPVVLAALPSASAARTAARPAPKPPPAPILGTVPDPGLGGPCRSGPDRGQSPSRSVRAMSGGQSPSRPTRCMAVADRPASLRAPLRFALCRCSSLILALLLTGLVVGALARLALPGTGPDADLGDDPARLGGLAASAGSSSGLLLERPAGSHRLRAGARSLVLYRYRRFVQHRPLVGSDERRLPRRLTHRTPRFAARSP